MDDETLASWRHEYTSVGLSEAQLSDEPFVQLGSWLAQAREAGLWEPNAMVLSTVDADAGPSSRMVLLKRVEGDSVVFYTNYDSRKGADLGRDPRCSLLFPWHALERQVRVDGRALRLTAAESDGYFARRPRAAQLGAWASPQSRVVESREALDAEYDAMSERWPESAQIPRPQHWGGYRVVAEQVEFWQGRSGRMHDRLRYRRAREGGWLVERLAP